MKSILMICRGNICRSPMAEGFFSYHLKKHLSPIIVSSAGLSALVNKPADVYALSVMKKNNIDISNHRARQLNLFIVRNANLIFVMSRSQLRSLSLQFPSAQGKTFLLGHWQGFEIADPFNQQKEKFEQVYQLIELAWQAWKTRILSC